MRCFVVGLLLFLQCMLPHGSLPQVHGATLAENKIIRLVRAQCPMDVIDELRWREDADILSSLRAHRCKDVGDFFAGCGVFYAEALSGGLKGFWLDNTCDPLHDICSTAGFATWILSALSLVVGGLGVFGIPCTTFCWLALGHTKRSPSNALGDTSRPDVLEANLMLHRCIFILKLLCLRSVFWLIENPLRSALWFQPAWCNVRKFLHIDRHRTTRVLTYLGAFGCEIAKPVVFQGVCPGAQHVGRARPKRFAGKQQVQTLGWYSWLQKRSDGTTKRRFMGKRHLKNTGQYPKELCVVLVKICKWQKANRRQGKL